MKKLIYVLYGAFFMLMGLTFYVAYHVNDGLVERHYYEKSLEFFDKKGISQATGTERLSPDCDIDRGACAKKTAGGEVIFSIIPKPVRAMEELAFRLVVRPDPRTAVLILGLGMPGMYMGENQLLLKKNPDGTYTGKGVIPGCPSGGRLWKATVKMPNDEEVSFTFNVTY